MSKKNKTEVTPVTDNTDVVAKIGQSDTPAVDVPTETPTAAFVPSAPVIHAFQQLQSIANQIAGFCAINLNNIAQFSAQVHQAQINGTIGTNNTPEPPTSF